MSTNLPKMPLGAKIFVSVSLTFMMVGGVAMMVKAFRDLSESREAHAWPTAPGKVTLSEMSVSTGKTHRSKGNRRELETSQYYEAKIEYEFEVAGVTYHGTRRTASQDMNANQTHTVSVLSRYPVKQPVTVSYKPDDPSTCVLEPGGWGGFFVMLPLSLVFSGIPLVLLLIAWKARTHSAPSRTPNPNADQSSGDSFESS